MALVNNKTCFSRVKLPFHLENDEYDKIYTCKFFLTIFRFSKIINFYAFAPFPLDFRDKSYIVLSLRLFPPHTQKNIMARIRV